MNYTKGPWHVHGGEFIRDSEDRGIAYCQSASGKRSVEEVHANALLVSKATAMYEALKKIEKITDVVLDRASVSDGELSLANDIFSLVNSALEE